MDEFLGLARPPRPGDRSAPGQPEHRLSRQIAGFDLRSSARISSAARPRVSRPPPADCGGERSREPLVSSGHERSLRRTLLVVGQCFLGAYSDRRLARLRLVILSESRKRSAYAWTCTTARSARKWNWVGKRRPGAADREGPLEARGARPASLRGGWKRHPARARLATDSCRPRCLEGSAFNGAVRCSHAAWNRSRALAGCPRLSSARPCLIAACERRRWLSTSL